MSSRTSTRPAPLARPTPPAVDTGFRPWHLYILLSMLAATAAVVMARQTHPAALLVLSAAVIAAGVTGLTIHYALSGFFGGRRVEPGPLAVRTRDAMLADKALILRSIKELEFDHAMKKVSDADFADMKGRLRLRALTLMEALERGPSPPEPAPASPAPAASDVDAGCESCGVSNDADAKFCKNCGQRLEDRN